MAGAARYEVIRELGEGGMGRVYEAVHHPSERVVAIKTLRTELALSSSQRLLLNEAAAAAQIAHPNIVELLDVGRDEHGVMFLVMELVRGSSLEAWASAFPGMHAVFRAFDQILDALATAHAQGIVHGDLKPANVLTTADGQVKITDFGVAHVIDPLRAEQKRQVQGTPFYMAPEQLTDPSAIGPSTDLYAVGVMLYQQLSAHEPFSTKGSLVEIIGRKLTHVRPLEPRAGLAVSPALAELVMSLLDANPRTRPRFAARVRAALAEIARNAPDAQPSVVASSLGTAATFLDATIARAPTIESSSELPKSPTTQALFSLPCDASAGPDVALHLLRPLPLVGRSAQSERLHAAAADVIAGRGARAVLVSGRAGEGKTRLVRQGFSDVEREGTMLGAAASFDETISNAQVGLRASIARLLGKPRGTLDDTLEGPWSWLTRVPQPGVDLSRAFDWVARADRPLEAKAASNVAAECLLAASRVFPVYLWLDDVAWSRDGAMELVLRLLERNDARVLAVGTLRSGTAEHPAVRAWLHTAVEQGARHEVLEGLSVADRARLVAAAAPIAPEVAERIAEELDEPALVLVETVRAWVDEGAEASSVTMRSASAVFARRIGLLVDGFGAARDAAERVLMHAALLGLRFEDRALRACAGAEAHIDAVLDRALLTGLLRLDGRDAYRFEHRLFLDATLERLATRKDASAIRCATADALIATYGRRDIESSLAAAKLHRAGGDDEAAVRLAGESVAASVRSSLFERTDAVLDLIASWVEDLPPDHLHRGVLEAARGQTAYFKLDYETAREHLKRALEIFEKSGTRADVHATLFHLSSAYFYDDRFMEAERCIAFVNEPVVEPVSRARAHHRLAELAAMRGDLDAAIEHERLTGELCAQDDVHFQFVTNINLVDFQVSAGRIDDAIATADVARANIMKIQDRMLTAEFEHTVAVIEIVRGDVEAARVRLNTWLEGLVARGDRWQATGARALLMLCAASTAGADVEHAVGEFIDSYSSVSHDEAITWWATRSTLDRLRARGSLDLAARLAAMLEARLEHIRRAFAR